MFVASWWCGALGRPPLAGGRPRSGGCRAAARWTGGRSDDQRAVLDVQYESAVATGLDRCAPAEIAHRTSDPELVAVLGASRGPEGINEPVGQAMREAGREDGSTVGIELGFAWSLVIRDGDHRPPDEVDHPGDREDRDDGPEDADDEEDRQQPDEGAPVGKDQLRREVEERVPEVVEGLDHAGILAG